MLIALFRPFQAVDMAVHSALAPLVIPVHMDWTQGHAVYSSQLTTTDTADQIPFHAHVIQLHRVLAPVEMPVQAD